VGKLLLSTKSQALFLKYLQFKICW